MTQFFLAAMLGVLFSIGTYLVLRCNMVRVIRGISIISQSANVYLVTMGGFGGLAPILSGHGASGFAPPDPIVRALVLTAIVIGFGMTTLALVLTYRAYEGHGTTDIYKLGGGR